MQQSRGKTVTVQVAKHINALPEHVYDAWLDAGTAAKFMFATPDGQMVRAETNPKVGGKFCFTDRRGDDDIEHTGQYLKLVRPNHIKFDFWVPKFMKEDQRTIIAVEIRPTPKGCEIVLTHDGVWPDYEERTKKGWEMMLNGLEKAVT